MKRKNKALLHHTNWKEKALSIVTVLFFCLFSLGQLQRVQVSSNIAFYLYDILIVVSLPFFLIYYKKYIGKLKRKLSFSRFSLEYLFFSWMSISIILWGAFLSQFIDIYPILFIARIIVYVLFSLFLTLHILSITKKQFSSITPYAISGLLVLLWGYIQYLLLPDTRYLSILGWDDHYYRLISTFFDPAFTGMAFVLTYIFIQTKESDFFKKYSFFSIIKTLFEILLIVGVLFTYSRASYIALFIAIIGIQIIYRKSKAIFIKNGLFLLCAFLLIPLLPRPTGEGIRLERTSTVYSRIDTATMAITDLQPHQWILGRGLPTTLQTDYSIITANHATVPDNLFIFIFSTSGVIGLFMFVFLLAKWMGYLVHSDQILLVALLTLLAHSMFNNTLLQPFIFLMAMALVANMIWRKVLKT